MTFKLIKPGEKIPLDLLKNDRNTTTIFSKCVECNSEYEHHESHILSTKPLGNPCCPKFITFQFPCEHNDCPSTRGRLVQQVIET